MPALCITNTPTKARQKVVLVSTHLEPGAIDLWSRFGQEAPRRGEPAGGVPQRGGGGSPCPRAGQHGTEQARGDPVRRRRCAAWGGHPVLRRDPDGQHALTHPPLPGGSPCPPAWSRWKTRPHTSTLTLPHPLAGRSIGGHPLARAAKASGVTLSALRSRGRTRGRKPLGNTTNPFNYSPLSKLINGGGFQQI